MTIVIACGRRSRVRHEVSNRSGGRAPARAARMRVLGLFTLTGLGAFLVSLDVSVANSLLPAIGGDYGVTSRAALSWVITAYAITFAAVLVPAGRIADRAGRRGVFLAGLGVFALGSLACGLAPDLAFLTAGRVVQGAGAAAASPASLGLLLHAVPPGRRAVASARWAGMGALGIGLGPIIGGLFTEALSWRWAFLVNVPFIAVAWLSGPAVLPESGRHPGLRLPDPMGVVTFAAPSAATRLTSLESRSTPSTWPPAQMTVITLVADSSYRAGQAGSYPGLGGRFLAVPQRSTLPPSAQQRAPFSQVSPASGSQRARAQVLKSAVLELADHLLDLGQLGHDRIELGVGHQAIFMALGPVHRRLGQLQRPESLLRA